MRNIPHFHIHVAFKGIKDAFVEICSTAANTIG
jgi:hypothetical protein